MKVVGIDAMILIYSQVVPATVPKSLTQDQLKERLDLGRRSKILLEYLSRKKYIVVLPTIAVAELLVKVPRSEKGGVIAALGKRFLCPSFDLRAAAIASDLWARYKDVPDDLQYENRNTMKADAMIIGSLIASGGSTFYSHDKGARKMASLQIKAEDLPMRDPEGLLDFPDSPEELGSV